MPVHIVDHPLVHDALAELRDTRTTPDRFRRAATRISVLLAAEAMREVPTRMVTVDTPLGRFELHHVTPAFVRGFDRERGFPLATPEKALVDTLYLSATRDRTLSRLPEIELLPAFSRARARRWVGERRATISSCWRRPTRPRGWPANSPG